jgi:hypothetical protein
MEDILMKNILFISLLVLIGATSCKKNLQFTKDHLDFSKDTVLFDTVFTTVGSTTQRLKIYNYNNQPINIEDIQLMGGSSSPFRINVDGVSSDFLKDVEIPAQDSLFVFVEVTLQVNNATNPLVISDSIRFKTNGVNQYVNLDVWGQDAYFHVNELVEGSWASDKPHVLYGTVAVGYPGLDSNKCLTIPAGVQVYGHKNSQLLVYKSCIDIQGTLGNEVVFQGDRLESFYDDISGQWWGIRLIEANTSNIDYAIIKNGSVGLQVDSTQAAITLNMNNTIISNHDFFALNVNAGPVIYSTNCLFGDAGLLGTYLFAGGEYHFTNCDFVNYWPGSRGGPALALDNNWEFEGITFVRDVINSEFNSCLVYGTIEDEFVLDSLPTGTFNCLFRNNYLKRTAQYTYADFTNTLWSGDPLFVDVSERDLHVNSASPIINAGSSIFGEFTNISLDGVISQGAARDIGCFEFQP